MLPPVFLLTLDYRCKGGFAARLMGTLLLAVVQPVAVLGFTPDHWRMTALRYVACGTLAISVGWLSEQQNGYYGRALERDRMAATGQLALTMKREITNAFTTITRESQLLASADENMKDDDGGSIKTIHDFAARVANDADKLTLLQQAPRYLRSRVSGCPTSVNRKCPLSEH